MRTRLTLTPGQNGTKHLVDKYGDRLVCVRYRYDEAKQRRLKTVELIVEESEWLPARRRLSGEGSLRRGRAAGEDQSRRRPVRAAA